MSSNNLTGVLEGLDNFTMCLLTLILIFQNFQKDVPNFTDPRQNCQDIYLSKAVTLH